MLLPEDTPAPEFELADQFGAACALSDLRGRRGVALVFFPLAFSPTCTGEWRSLHESRDLFDAAGVRVVGISVDSTASLRAYAEREGLDATLLADFWPHGAVARRYGAFLEQRGFATRATYLIDAAGIIRARFATPPGEARPIDAYRAAIATLAATTATATTAADAVGTGRD